MKIAKAWSCDNESNGWVSKMPVAGHIVTSGSVVCHPGYRDRDTGAMPPHKYFEAHQGIMVFLVITIPLQIPNVDPKYMSPNKFEVKLTKLGIASIDLQKSLFHNISYF